MLAIYTLYVAYLVCVLTGIAVALLVSVPLGVIVASLGLVLGAFVVSAWQLRKDYPL